MAFELEPLSWKKFEQYHRIAWENGWTYGPAHTELYLEYLKNWECFIKYIQNLTYYLLLSQNKCIKILIGEAPPFWAGNSSENDRSYFYNENQTRGSTWLNAPFKYFHYLEYPKGCSNNRIDFDPSKNSLTFKKPISSNKPSRLDFLAQQGVILLDIFPFPIRQATKIRETVTADFSVHLEEYFCDFYNKVKNYIKNYIFCIAKTNVQFKYALVTPILTGLQILYGSKSRLVFQTIVTGDSPLEIENLITLSPARMMYDIKTYESKTFRKKNAFKSFFTKIAFDDIATVELNPFVVACSNAKTPILMDESGNVNFTKFFNSHDPYLQKKINSKETESEDND